MDAVCFSDFGFRYSKGGFCLSGISLKVKKGEFFAVLGRSGSGKSTLLLAINGIVPNVMEGRCSGELRVMGQAPAREGVKRMSRLVSFVFQDPNDQIFCQSVIEEVMFGPLNLGKERKEAERAAMDALRLVGMERFAKSDPADLSYGQKQKVAVACAVAMDTPVIVLDEPVASMDFESANEIYGLLSKLNGAGKTIVVSEHDTDLLAGRADHAAIMKDGKVKMQGGVEIFESAEATRLGVRPPCTCRK